MLNDFARLVLISLLAASCLLADCSTQLEACSKNAQDASSLISEQELYIRTLKEQQNALAERLTDAEERPLGWGWVVAGVVVGFVVRGAVK